MAHVVFILNIVCAPTKAFRQHSLMLAAHFSLHFSARLSFNGALFVPLTSATTARVLDTSTSSAVAEDLLMACLAIGTPSIDDNGLDVVLADAALLLEDLPE